MSSKGWPSLMLDELSLQIFVLGQNRISQMGKHFREGGKDDSRVELFLWVIVVPLAIAILLIAWWQSRSSETEDTSSPAQLFRELCRSHQLTLPQQLTLRKIAQLAKVSSPAIIFVRRDLFETAVAGFKEDKPRFWWQRNRSSEQIEDLRKTLYS